MVTRYFLVNMVVDNLQDDKRSDMDNVRHMRAIIDGAGLNVLMYSDASDVDLPFF